MPDGPLNAKIYDRPERKGPSPLLLVIGLIVVLVLGYLAYRTFLHPAAPPQHSQAGTIRVQAAFWREVEENGRQTSYGVR